MQDVYILSAVRTPIGKFGGSLASMTAADMGVVAATSAIDRAGIAGVHGEQSLRFRDEIHRPGISGDRKRQSGLRAGRRD